MSSEKSYGRFDDFRKRWGLLIAIACMIIVWLLPTPADLSPEGKRALILFSGVFILYLTEALPLPVTSLAIVPAAVLMDTASLKFALAGFSSSSVYLIVGAFILSSAMVKTRLAERITYMILNKIGCSPRRITFGVMLANIFLAFLVPSSTARTAILLPVCISIIGLFQQEGRSRFSVNILLVLAFTNATISAGILTATVPNVVTLDFISKAGGSHITYGQWFNVGFPPALLMTLITWYLIQLFFRPEHKQIAGGEGYISKQLQQFGNMSNNEWRTLAIFFLVVLLWTTGTWTKLDATTACLIGASLLFFPKFGVLNWSDANKGISWQVVFICGGGVSLGHILMETGAATWVANSIFHSLNLGTLSTLMLLVVVMCIIQYLHILFVGTTAMATAFLPIVISLGKTAGLSPEFLALPAGMLIGGYPLLMFYNTMPNILVYGTGRINSGDFPMVGVLVCFVACVIYALSAAFYWPFLGVF
ncbi:MULTISPECIES: SLC13 family permease [Pectobacterium]|uniref:SLC13 family permease n=1 Tax=Pectobacterium TaxID=122277 RepID=UPI001888BF48|nr:DASS family sodium-coupled anion symporter [Pectobacterium carotovorum]MBG0753262.1 hypothetical protein [Pectobacterium carotovorum subsp. carotovorum PCCS1]